MHDYTKSKYHVIFNFWVVFLSPLIFRRQVHLKIKLGVARIRPKTWKEDPFGFNWLLNAVFLKLTKHVKAI